MFYICKSPKKKNMSKFTNTLKMQDVLKKMTVHSRHTITMCYNQFLRYHQPLLSKMSLFHLTAVF